jgi:hypothetical protein|tara:strand:+ start:676 stop:837 length:162 start_codon:yes stop_codon:yes gene_type:complete
MKKIIKSETKNWFEEVGEDGVRRIRIETSTEVHFSNEKTVKHNPIVSSKVEYL